MVTMFVLILDVGVMARETVLMDLTRPTVVRSLITQQIALLCFVLLFASDKNLLRVDDKKCKQEVPQLEDILGFRHGCFAEGNNFCRSIQAKINC